MRDLPLLSILARNILTCGLLLASVSTTWADDLDVYGVNGQGAGTRLPNMLFIFDTSASMNRSVDGALIGSLNKPSKLDILHEAVEKMLDASEGRINVGVTSFNSTARGIKWPISNLNEEARMVDPAIEPEILSKEVINSIIANEPTGGQTATVDSLYEAARYYRGEPVWVSGLTNTRTHKPHSWSPFERRYQGGNAKAAHPAAYSPINAYEVDHHKVAGKTKACYDYTVDGKHPDAVNYCENRDVKKCDMPSTGNRVWDPDYCSINSSSYVWNCTRYDTTGSECITGYGSCTEPGGYTGTEEHRKCYYKEEDSYEDLWNGATYNSPISQSCQANYIVLLSDGAPSENFSRPLVESLLDSDCKSRSGTIFGYADGSYPYGDCGIELVEFLAQEDQHPNIRDSRINTYTIGFGLSGPGGVSAQNYLKSLASAGGGEFLLADDADELIDAFENIVTKISGDSETLTGISVDVDRAVGMHNEQVYVNLFQPSPRNSWDGNLKGFYAREDGLHDQLDNPATELSDVGTVFKESSKSFWSSTTDGNIVEKGGANTLISKSRRKLFSNLLSKQGVFNLSAPSNSLSMENSFLEPIHFGAEYVQNDIAPMIDWLEKAPMGSPLHSSPVKVRYQDRNVVFSMTNQGILHAFDASSTSDAGVDRELFGFMPKQLIKNIPRLTKRSYTGNHIYGLDGSISKWHDDSISPDGIVNSGEKIILFFGMRRGGDAYYALDVSDIGKPELLWKIDANTVGFEQLGQSWSRMSVVTLPWQGTQRKMLVFGGGYNTRYDNDKLSASNTSDTDATNNQGGGNAIYFIELQTGKLLWSVSNFGADTNDVHMRHSIPGDLRIIDVNRNGIADRIYFGDLGGQIWRLKLDETAFGWFNGLQVTRLANLSNDSERNTRRFFYPPAVYFSASSGEKYLGVSFGSGDRANPLDTSSRDRIYTLRDADLEVDFSSAVIRDIDHSSLVERNVAALVKADAAEQNLKDSHGWYITLSEGEKALSQIIAFEGQILFTTYEPSINDKSQDEYDHCSVDGSKGRFYALNQSNATIGNLLLKNKNNRSHIEVQTDGIPSAPVIVFTEPGGSADVYVDTSKMGTIDNGLRKVFWHAK